MTNEKMKVQEINAGIRKEAKVQEIIAGIRKEAKVQIETTLNKLGKLETAIYNYMLHKIYVDDNTKELVSRYNEQVQNGTTETSLEHLLLKSWVKGLIDGFRGQLKISEDKDLQTFVKLVFEAADLNALIDTHVEILRLYVVTEAKIKEVLNENKQSS